MACRPVGLLGAVAAACVLATGGCGVVRFQDPNGIKYVDSESKFYSAPASGRYLCLSTQPGLPVRLHPESGPIIGLTRDVVAFHGEVVEHYIRIVYYDGALGWMDGLKIRPYTGPRRDSSCIIPGVDLQQRPVFVIR